MGFDPKMHYQLSRFKKIWPMIKIFFFVLDSQIVIDKKKVSPSLYSFDPETPFLHGVYEKTNYVSKKNN